MNKYPYLKTVGVATFLGLSSLFSNVSAQGDVSAPSSASKPVQENIPVRVDNRLYNVRVVSILGDDETPRNNSQDIAFGVAVYDSLNVRFLTSIVGFIKDQDKVKSFNVDKIAFISAYVANEINANPKRFGVMEPRP